jgi:hypothetical protein
MLRCYIIHNLRIYDLFGQSEVLSSSFQQSRLVDRTLSVIPQHKRTIRADLISLLLHIPFLNLLFKHLE